jgi:hypothetical protein
MNYAIMEQVILYTETTVSRLIFAIKVPVLGFFYRKKHKPVKSLY